MNVTINDFEYHVSEPFKIAHPGPDQGRMKHTVSYRLRLKIPFGYGDGLWRLSVYTWFDEDGTIDPRGWFAKINATVIGRDYESPESAARAIRRALGKVARSLEKCVTVKLLVPVVEPV